MTNTEQLNLIIKESGLKKSYLAYHLGLSLKGLQNKLENDTEFKASEIVVLQQLLGMDDKMRDRIFLGKE